MIVLKQREVVTSQGQNVVVKWFGEVPYQDSHSAMMAFANTRADEDNDEIWLLEHPRVYTQGTACDLDTFIPSDIPVVKTDRGGQITYHGPGQIVMYPLLKLKRHGLGVKLLVDCLEQAVINVLADRGVDSDRKEGAPGVYVDQAKVAALGLRIRKGTSYHGLSCNVDMDLTPFKNIDPCGFQGLKVAQLKDLDSQTPVPIAQEVGNDLADTFLSFI